MWELEVLTKGEWPSHDWDNHRLTGWRWDRRGQRLCGKYHFPTFMLACDLDYSCNYLDLQHFNDAVQPCFRCRCNRTTSPHTDLRPNANWRGLQITMLMWFFTEKHILFSNSRVGLNLFHVTLDTLHMMDLGIDQDIAASIILLLIWEIGLPGNFDERSHAV